MEEVWVELLPGGLHVLTVGDRGETQESVQVVDTSDAGPELAHYERNHELPDKRLAPLTAHLLFVEEGEDDGVGGVVAGEDPGELQSGDDSTTVIIGARAGRHRVPVSRDHHWKGGGELTKRLEFTTGIFTHFILLQAPSLSRLQPENIETCK